MCNLIDFVIFPCADYDNQHIIVTPDELVYDTEAGIMQRDVVRLGVVSISVSFSVTPKWLKLLTGFKQWEKIGVEYFDTETLESKKAEMFIAGYKAGLVKDTSYKGLWRVSFTLREFWNRMTFWGMSGIMGENEPGAGAVYVYI